MPDIKAAIVGAPEETAPTTSTDVLPLVNAAGTTFKHIKLVTLFEAIDALQYKGVIDCSTNPNYPAANAGHVYKVSVAGKIGGASGPNVEVGDTLLCAVDSSASGDHGTVGANWGIVQANLDSIVSDTAYNESSWNGVTTSAPSKNAVRDQFEAEPSAARTLTNKKISVSAALGSDDTYDAVSQIEGKNAGATIAQWEAVYLDGSSTWQLADANGTNTYPARGLSVAAYVNTNPAIVLKEGTVRNDSWAWTPGGAIYLSGTPGGLTQTQPSTSGDKVQAVGYALDADRAYFDFNSFFFTVT